MTIARAPDRAFAAVWLARYLAMIVLHVAWNPWAMLATASLFFPVEALGLVMVTGRRDQLSELWTWVLRKLSKHERPFAGWNWLAVIFATLEAATVYRLFDWGGMPAGFNAVICAALAAMLHAHWLRPQVHG